jgi:formylglycine-generating enzyme required for sulfatase activity
MNELVPITAGQVLIGSPERHLDALAAEQHYDRAWFEDEAPAHSIEVAEFSIHRFPVTNLEFDRFVADTDYVTDAERLGFSLVYTEDYWEEIPEAHWRAPGGPGDSIKLRPNHPVVHVSLRDAQAYAAWVGLRLPTEAEWEYACHGPEWRTWPWGDYWDERRLNCAEFWSDHAVSDAAMWKSWWTQRRANGAIAPATTPVGQFSPIGDSPFGVCDLAGNVSEWTSTVYSLYGPPEFYLPTFRFAAGRYTVIRGGSWMNFRYQVRCCERMAADPARTSFNLGFRCAR